MWSQDVIKGIEQVDKKKKKYKKHTGQIGKRWGAVVSNKSSTGV